MCQFALWRSESASRIDVGLVVPQDQLGVGEAACPFATRNREREMTVVVGLIGAGVMGADHANTLASAVAGVRIRAIADADLTRAESVAKATGADVATINPMANA
jgi:glutamyl-tRNA reductase